MLTNWILRYHAYSSWPANLCITKMSDPWTVASNHTERQIIRWAVVFIAGSVYQC